ncbi:MAG: polysaccharide deacetylase family protein [Bacteroidales bacterium]|nr:MAG: polysaccharide deacetylase family protein [Bacteroidales bacterium]
MVSARTPYIIKKIYYSLIWDLYSSEKDLYLTFDDGPVPDITLEVLDILETYNAKATFFCIGRNVERYPEIYNQILKKGHAAGNHTYSHLKGWKTKSNDYYSDIELAGSFINSNLFRPPYGKIKRAQLKHLRYFYNIIMWDVMSFDFRKSISKEKCLSIVLNNIRQGSIIVFHDSVKAREKVLYALPEVLKVMQDKGYTFKSIRLDKKTYPKINTDNRKKENLHLCSYEK